MASVFAGNKFNQLDDEADAGGGEREAVFDLASLDKQEASKHLFGQVPWDDYLRAGVFLNQNDFQLLERAQDNLDYAMGNPNSAKAFASLLLKLADKCTAHVAAQQYVFTRVEEILAVPNDSFLKQRGQLFTVDGVHIHDAPFLRALRSTDSYTQRSASTGLALLLSVHDGDVASMASWLVDQLSSPVIGAADVAVPALTILMRRHTLRLAFSRKGGINHVVSTLVKLGGQASAQQQYDLTFVLWALSLDEEETDYNAYLLSGSIRLLVEMVAAAPSRKVVRMAMATLNNLAKSKHDDILTEMLTGGLTKLLENIIHANAHKQAGDPEVEADVKDLYEVLMRNYREFSTFERWIAEVNTGLLRWGIVHTEKFWRENAKLMENQDFKMLKNLIALLHSDSETVIAVALYDLGEFTRFYPNGRGVVKSLGGKDTAMELIDHPNPDIRRQALQCISKVMVTNWEFMK